MVGYTNSDWAISCEDMKNTSSYLFLFETSVFSRNSKKQEIVAQSTAEVEYITVVADVNQAIWLRKLLVDLWLNQKEPTEFFCDN